MSSAVVSTSAAWSRHVVFEDEVDPEVSSVPGIGGGSRATLDRTAEGGCPYMIQGLPAKEQFQHVVQSTIKNQQSTIPLAPASRLEIRPAPEMVPSGIPAIDELTTVLLAALAAATRRGDYCALVDACDALDAHSAAAAGVELDRLLWVRCGEGLTPTANLPRRHRDTEKQNLEMKNPGRYTNQSEIRLEQVLRATDLLLESGGFGMIVLDLADLPPQMARRIPLTTWFRFRRAIERTPTILLAIEQQAIAGSCSSLLLQLGSSKTLGEARRWDSRNTDNHPTHAHLLTGLNIEAELIRSRLERKPARSVSAFASKTAWAR